MSERLTDQLTTQIIASIRRMTDEQLGHLIRSQCADEAALRAENERLKARCLPNLDAMSVEDLSLFLNQIESVRNYIHAAMFTGNQTKQEQIYAALPTWAKFREE